MIVECEEYGRVFNIGSGKSVALKEILDYIISLSATVIEVRTDAKLIRPVENRVIRCDHSLITEKLGWMPKYDIFETVKEIFDYYVDRERNR